MNGSEKGYSKKEKLYITKVFYKSHYSNSNCSFQIFLGMPFLIVQLTVASSWPIVEVCEARVKAASHNTCSAMQNKPEKNSK